ncbi:MAG: DUF3568 family protein [Candidatus Omnitrophota bacterium]
MKMRLLSVVLAVTALGLSGCAAVLVGAGVAGGYALSKDSVKNQYARSKDRVFQSSLAAAREMGQVVLEDAKTGIIQAKVEDTDVTITVKPLTAKTVELEVKARNKFKMPALDVAQRVHDNIDDRVKRKRWLFF